jgi:hypothetical protein
MPPTTRVTYLGEQRSIALDELPLSLDLLSCARCPRGSGGRARFSLTSVSGCACGHEALAKPHAQTVSCWRVRDDVCTQPVPQHALHVFAGPPWRVVVEQQSDDGLDRDHTHQTALIPQSLVDEARKELQTLTLRSAQLRPRIAEQRIWITEREERLAGYVSPALAVAGRYEPVEGGLQSS